MAAARRLFDVSDKQGQSRVIMLIGTEKYGRYSGITGVVTYGSNMNAINKKNNGTGEMCRYVEDVVINKCRYGQVTL